LVCGAPLGARAHQGLDVNLKTGANGAYDLEASGVLDAPRCAVQDVLMHMCDLPELVPTMTQCRLYARDASRSWTYVVVSPPFLSARDFTMLRTVETGLPDGSHALRWTEDNAHGPLPVAGHVRVTINRGVWRLWEHHSGTQTRFEYQVHATPGGWVPSWLAGFVARQAVPDMMRNIVRHARSRRGAANMLESPDPWAVLPLTPLTPQQRVGMSTAPSAQVP